MRSLVMLLLLALVAAPLAAQDDTLDFENRQYKRVHRNAVLHIVRGNAQAVVDALLEARNRTSTDHEDWFVLGVAYGYLGDMDEAMTALKRSLELGLPWQRLWTERNNLLRFLSPADFQALAGTGPEPVAHFMRGQLAHDQSAFWARGIGPNPMPFSVAVSASGNFDVPDAEATAVTSPERDHTGVAVVTGLQPETEYTFRLYMDDRPWREGAFRTLPTPGSPIKLEAGFGGGAGYTPHFEYMWNTILERKPEVFFLLGDNIYPDAPENLEVVQYCYYRRQSRPEFSAFAANTSVFSIWDDHDFGMNDCWGGPDIHEPAWKLPVWRVFRDNWVNPGYGGGETQPGVWYSHQFGDIDVFMLDGRYYRTDPESPNPSMLGPVQKAWLKDQLLNSKATFKVLASPVPFVSGTKPGSLDTWDGYPEEREELLAFLAEHRIEGFFVISADRHRSDVWKMDWPAGYPIWEFESSKLTNVHTHQPEPGALFSYNEKCSYGRLSFDTTLADPEVTYRIVNIDGEVMHEHTLRRSELRFE